MAKADNPITFGRQFEISSERLDELGVLNCTLAIDTRLFIDPLLLSSSKHEEIQNASEQYRTHFEQVIALLKASRCKDDAAWKAARKKLKFPEVNGTCLGYGAGSIHGSGFGKALTEKILQVASEIVEIGVEDPSLFPAMALFEANIGPDRISDMTTNVIFNSLAQFNERILGSLNLKGKKFSDRIGTGIFLENPFESKPTPIILVPSDVLRDLPVAQDWDGIVNASAKNEELRDNVNKHIAEIWAKKNKRAKGVLKNQALTDGESFKALLAVIAEADHSAYSTSADPEGLIKWATSAPEYAEENPIALHNPAVKNTDSLLSITSEIVTQFAHLIENCGLNHELYKENKKPRHESTAQRLFFAVAYAYCKSNDIDISPEIDTGTGKVDFKFSIGFNKRVLVEIKLSTNPSTVSGYTTQLELYKKSQETCAAIYLVIDVGSMGEKDVKLLAIKNKAVQDGEPVSDLEFVDGSLKPPASKRKS